MTRGHYRGELRRPWHGAHRTFGVVVTTGLIAHVRCIVERLLKWQVVPKPVRLRFARHSALQAVGVQMTGVPPTLYTSAHNESSFAEVPEYLEQGNTEDEPEAHSACGLLLCLASSPSLFRQQVCFLPANGNFVCKIVAITLYTSIRYCRHHDPPRAPVPFTTTCLPATSSYTSLAILTLLCPRQGTLVTTLPSDCVSFTLCSDETGRESGKAGSTIAKEDCDRDTVHTPSAKTTTCPSTNG
ncbi:hypothetical protein C8F01DRAFT_1260415 [Mycena amicta]|nr:hypothetical protein C8F01DRAFT_1260415 [Mycena amicta]